MVAVTDLHNLGMPFIRYANGDMATVGAEGRCSCGRALPRLASVDGRVVEQLRDGDGALVNGLLFNIVFTYLAEAAKQFQVVQHKDRSVTVKIIPGEGYDGAAADEVRRNIQRYLKGVRVDLQPVAEIPATSGGKRRFVVVET